MNQISMRFLHSLLLAGLLAHGSMVQAKNELANHPSPYLALHGHDPVDWHAWGKPALQQARKADRLIYISSGYFSCHWCHVMQKESYQDPAVAERLARLAVAVKVDRELDPALDAHLIDFVERTTGRAGWPLNVFLTPEGYPLLGFTYMPKERFVELLGNLEKLWATKRAETKDLARRAMLSRLLKGTGSGASDERPATAQELIKRIRAQALGVGDELSGGFGDQNKFPMVPQLSALLEIQRRDPDAALAGFLTLTLDRMAREGLRDQLAGGFFRYTVDPQWQVPHFEKMLYTQAMMAELYFRAAEVLRRPVYTAVARDTLAFTFERMGTKGGGYIASLSAVDAQGKEGGNYLWSKEELGRLLSAKELPIAQRRWLLQGAPQLEGEYLPRMGASVAEIAKSGKQTPDDVRKRLVRIKDKLLKVRDQRPLPRDTKVLAGWNGLMLKALAVGQRALPAGPYRVAGDTLAKVLSEQLWNGSELMRMQVDGKAVGAASLQDYAFVADGLIAWGRVTGNAETVALGRHLLQLSWDRFYDKGWRTSDQFLLPGLVGEPLLGDGPLPAPSAMVMRLSLQSGDDDLIAKAKVAMARGGDDLRESAFWHVGHAMVIIGATPPG